MDDETKKQLDLNYEARIQFIAKLKKDIENRILVLKFVILALLVYFIYVPSYVAFYKLYTFINITYQGRYNFIIEYYPFVFVLIAILIVFYLLIYGNLPFKTFFFLEGLSIMIIVDKNYIFWIFKFVGLIVLYKIPDILKKMVQAYDNYKSYNEKYVELYSLRSTFDTVSKMYFEYIVIFLLGSYVIIMMFESISINIGVEASIIFPLLLIPLIIFILFYSPDMFTIKRFYLKKQSNENS